MQKFIEWCGSNTTGAKVARTVAQGIVSLLIVMIPMWAGGHLPPVVTASLVPAIMAVLAAFQSWLGKKGVYEDIPLDEIGGADVQ